MKMMARLMSLGLLLIGLISSASAASVATQCGVSARNTTKTTTAAFTFSSTDFAAVPNAGLTVEVPTGQQRCVTITFSASASCPLGCLMRALADETEMEPAGVDMRLAEGNSHEVHSFQWVKRLAAGIHKIKVQIRTADNSQNAAIGPYTATFDIAK